tara:strand:- start:10726 stop:11061 length:336 start_codon:yes stop_codon:yes gene_type:complete
MSAILSYADKRAAFKIATSALLRWYGDELAGGASDERLSEMLVAVLGIFGGSSGPESLDISFKGAGLKIWASWDTHNTVTDKPVFSGHQTVRMAREVYGITDPTCDQLALL